MDLTSKKTRFLLTDSPRRRRERDGVVSGKTPGMKRHHFNQKRW